MSLLPSRPDTSAADEAEPQVVGVDSDRADALMAALSSRTARDLLTALHEEPGPPSELADRVDTSLQNVQYHLEKLDDAGAVEVIDTAYSEKGREMDIYAPADRPLVIFAGREEQSRSLRAALRELLAGFAALALGSLVVQELFGGSVTRLFSVLGGTGGADGEAPGDGAGAPPADTHTPTPEGTPAPAATDGGVGPFEQTPTPAATDSRPRRPRTRPRRRPPRKPRGRRSMRPPRRPPRRPPAGSTPSPASRRACSSSSVGRSRSSWPSASPTIGKTRV